MMTKGSIVRGVLLALGGLGLLAFLVFVRPEDPSDGGRRAVIQVWHPWGGPMLEAYQVGIDAFEKSHPDIACRTLYVPNDLSNSQKFYTAVIGNCAPEVSFVDGPQIAEWAERGLLEPLDDLLREQGIDPEKLKGEFFEPCWKQCVYKGKIWAITYCADPNFCYFWNKDAFRKAIASGEAPAGVIDPEKAPATIEELGKLNDVMTKIRKTSAGQQIERVGLVPWGVYGNANSLFTWGWAFGGEFYDAEHFKVTANDPKVVKAMEWMCEYSRKYGHERIAALQSSFGSAEQNPFIVGKQVMQLLHLSGIADMETYAPTLEYGTAPIPSGGSNGAWVGGWGLAIPAGLKDPAKRKAAMEFILWSCANAEGTSMAVRTRRNFPGWKPSPFFAEARKDPRMAGFVNILENARHQRPVMPAQAYYMDQLNRAVDRAIRGEMSPQQALDEATRETQKQLDKILARSEGRP